MSGDRWPIRRRLATWVVGSVLGAGILALLDADDRVFSFSPTHGPSPLDLAGRVILLLAWLPIGSVLWNGRRALAGPPARIAFVLLAVGAIMLVVTIRLDLGATYLIAVAMLLAAQLLALRVVAKGGGGR